MIKWASGFFVGIPTGLIIRRIDSWMGYEPSWWPIILLLFVGFFIPVWDKWLSRKEPIL